MEALHYPLALLMPLLPDRKIMWSDENRVLPNVLLSLIPDGATLFIDIGTLP